MTLEPIPGKTHDVGSETEVLAMIRTVLTEDDKTVAARKPRSTGQKKLPASLERFAVRPEQDAQVSRARAVNATDHAVFPALEAQEDVDPDAPTKIGPVTIPASFGIELFNG